MISLFLVTPESGIYGSLHRTLAESAAQEGVSLNQYVTMLLGRRDAQNQIERRLEAIEAQIAARSEQDSRRVMAQSIAH